MVYTTVAAVKRVLQLGDDVSLDAEITDALPSGDALVDSLLKQRYIKRQVERDIFVPVLAQAGYDPALAKVRLNWGSPETPEVRMEDLIAAATAPVPLIRPEEFRKNAVKFGWELWEQQVGG